MNLQEIETNVAKLDLSKGFDLIYDLLRAYGLPKASITRLQTGTYNRSDADNERLWKGKLYYRYLEGPDEDLHAVIDEAKNDHRVMKERPRFLVVRDDDSLAAIDTRTETTLDCELVDLPAHSAFFLPWAGIEKTQLENVNYADRKAAEKMAKLYDEIVKHNAIADEEDVRRLNIFFSRLLFCFFSEDTDVFAQSSFTNAIASLTKDDGSDTGRFLDALFGVLDTEVGKRDGIPAHFHGFGYVNGSLFSAQAPSPQFSPRARKLVLDCGTLDWSQINPDIFGSMIQAVVHPGQREGLGMHYTSVENIMKVIRPLFLDELEAAFDAADTVGKLEKLLDRIAGIKVFDPACGSGNFLVIAYKELRKLEHKVLVRLEELDPATGGLFQLSRIQLDHYYGIEIDDFAHEIAILSLWLAKHQMNVEFRDLFGVEISLIPLKDTGNIVCGNATRMDWREVCPVGDGVDVFVLGNPPYLGGRSGDTSEARYKADREAAFAPVQPHGFLDYVSAWVIKAARYIGDNRAAAAFVTTNSICQGVQVGALWPHVFEAGAKISFAHTSFRWSNQAKGNAGVSVAIIGLTSTEPKSRAIYTDGLRKEVAEISPYLTAGPQDAIVESRSSPISGLPGMTVANQPTDGGNLLLTRPERDELLTRHPKASHLVRRFMGASELLGATERFCLWIEDNQAEEAMSIPPIAERIERVRKFRASSKSAASRAVADVPWRFHRVRHRPGQSIIVPRHSSERREYIPLGFLDDHTIISDAANAIYDVEPWVFAVVQSRLHMTWVRAVGGALETRIRYTAGGCYNTFPVPPLTEDDKEVLTAVTLGVLEAREFSSELTLAQLYDPEAMPPVLRRAHEALDSAVEGLYRTRPFDSDDERLEHLFGRYQEAANGLVNA